VFASRSLSFLSRNFWESCYSSLCFNGCCTWVETEQKSRFTIMLTLMLLIKLCEVLYEESFQL
jgi:hypothetical protein